MGYTLKKYNFAPHLTINNQWYTDGPGTKEIQLCTTAYYEQPMVHIWARHLRNITLHHSLLCTTNGTQMGQALKKYNFAPQVTMNNQWYTYGLGA